MSLRLLVISGTVSAYTFELFAYAHEAHGIDTRFINSVPTERGPGFAHDRFVDSRFPCLDWAQTDPPTQAAFAREAAPDAVLLFGTTARRAIAAAIAALPTRIPFYLVGDSNIVASPLGLRRPIRSLAYTALSRRVTCALTLGLTNELAFHSAGIRTVDCPLLAVDYDGIRREQFSLPASNRPRTLLAIARLVPEKNIEALIVALGESQELASHVRLVVAGDGPLRARLESVVARYPHAEIVLLGSVRHAAVGSLIEATDGLVIPSVVEPWGIVVTEALGLGRPVLGTPAVGAAVSLAGRSAGLLISADPSPAGLRSMLLRWARSAPLFASCAAESAERVRARYSLQATAERVRLVTTGELPVTPQALA